MKRIAWAAGAAFLLMCGAAQARPINDAGMTIEEVSAWVKSAGYDPKVEKDDDGERYVTAKTTDGITFNIDLYDCEKARCRALQFTVSFDVKAPVTLAKANEWNQGKRYVKMYIDKEGDPYFQYDANVAPGGTFEALDDDLDVFVSFLPDITEHIDW